MVKKKYICSECGHRFSEELTQLIEEGTQVYCENCGTPFSVEGKEFVERDYKPPEKMAQPPREVDVPKGKTKAPKGGQERLSTLKKVIRALNDFSYIPILIVSILIFVGIVGIVFNPGNWIIILIRQISFGTSGLIITLYDKRVISKKIEENQFAAAFLESFCLGILGCIIYGSGVIILLKGILLTVYVIYTKSKQEHGLYQFFTAMKDSFLKFSSKFGFIILILALHGIVVGPEPLYKEFLSDIKTDFPGVNPLLIGGIILITLFSIALISLLIHNKIKNKLLYNPDISLSDFIKTMILGILATIYFASGVFIILEAVSLLILYFIKPAEVEVKPEELREEKEVINPFKKREAAKGTEKRGDKPVSLEKREKIEDEITKLQDEERSVPPLEESLDKAEGEQSTPIEGIKEKGEEEALDEAEAEEKKAKEKMEEYKLKLHESLLPVKDKKDKKLVKKYFSKIFTILSKDIKEKINNLNLSRKEKKEILKELAFLSREKQINYMNALVNLYQEQIPKKLVDRIRHLPNVKPEHYQKIVNELKYMDRDEQLQYIEHLEKFS